ncbi:uncharacterized protein si:ch211-191i18.4 [Syngnathus acus]|uniref:uncharacterized protein si:ch211-191i18.4 n=1 Tax=Syngnathus acus TaxID=161584 RepID=UPI001885B1B5|nr:uncharacterized protein si:ch211-191i18.4 [Syngnathus acus]
MKTSASTLLVLLLTGACLRGAICSLPTESCQVTGEAAPRRTITGRHLDDIRSGFGTGHRDNFRRLPGLCRRLRRRRFSYLCHKANYCWWGRSQGSDQSGQVCPCPTGSKCSRVFIRSI